MEEKRGHLVLDGTTLDKPYAREMGLLTYHWSGKIPRRKGQERAHFQEMLIKA